MLNSVKTILSNILQKLIGNDRMYSRVFMIAGGFLLLTTLWLPLWNIQLEAPQYPHPLGMNIYLDKIMDQGEDTHDIKNINILNHYVGMKEIPEHMAEFEIFPYVIMIMGAISILFGIIGNDKLYLLWFLIMAVLGSIGLYDFYKWEYDYGHDLDPNAILKFKDENGNPMGFQPPVIGSKTILNFVAHSYPHIGSFVIFISMGLGLLAFYIRYAANKIKKA
ncbi:MAG: hypothetical protein OEZ13_00245 [Spirochaetia bacterium]|nr:hypothetical protein [Spirochaetia bacterium]